MSTSETAGSSGTELATRVVVSVVACTLVTWQLVETANFRADANSVARRFQLGGTPLQWYLVGLMLLSALDGVVGVVVDILFAGAPEGAARLSAVREEIGIQLVLGKVSQLILSMMIIGLGVSGMLQGTRNAKVATVLGLASLCVRRLPAPLVLVSGCLIMQRTKPRGQNDADDSYSCFSLRCALRPLLALAMLEAVYASVIIDADFVERLEHSKHEAHRIVEVRQRGLITDEETARDTRRQMSQVRLATSLQALRQRTATGARVG